MIKILRKLKNYTLLINVIVWMIYLFIVITSFTTSIWILRIYFMLQGVCYFVIRNDKNINQVVIESQRLYWMFTLLVVGIAINIYMVKIILTLNINLYPLILLLETTFYCLVSLLTLQKISPYKITY